VGVGMEATGYSRWFKRLLAELGFDAFCAVQVTAVFGYHVIFRPRRAPGSDVGLTGLGQPSGRETAQ
jgi:hypothetical protein